MTTVIKRVFLTPKYLKYIHLHNFYDRLYTVCIPMINQPADSLSYSVMNSVEFTDKVAGTFMTPYSYTM